jgi:GST-like protein
VGGFAHVIELYTYPTANGQRASVMLAACGLEYRVHRIDLRAGESRTAEFLSINPAGGIPVIVDPDGPGGQSLALSQSGAIMLYLAEKTGRFLPSAPAERVEVLRWLMAVMTDPAAASASIFLTGMASDPPPAAAVALWERRLIDVLQVYDAQLAGQDWLAGALSIADLALYPTYVTRRSLIESRASYGNLARWAGRLDAMPAVQRGMSAGA